ncbi:hypothetical protein BLNAU_14538 [Blattamonas nauphoetae]|uniref:PB1 domain-containing protein n=1 Tax=Blattamonas nauphoetae TaxID=2049346 RepID=A0ABQ9XI89_9EUKA|nr:hypothetical protein BLNAU_14538 [Blattamonas nauphoetae]
MNTSQNQVIKITFSPTGDTRRVQFTEAPSFEELAARISSLFDDCSMATHRLTYIDDEGDAVTIASDEDVYLAFITQQPGEFLRITVSPVPAQRESRPEYFSESMWMPWGRNFRRPQTCPHHQNGQQPRHEHNRPSRPWWMPMGMGWDENVMRDQIASLGEDFKNMFPQASAPEQEQQPRTWFPFAQKEDNPKPQPQSQPEPSPKVTPQAEVEKEEEAKEDVNEIPQPAPREEAPQPAPSAPTAPQAPFGFGGNGDWAGMMQQFGPMIEQFAPFFQQFMQSPVGQSSSNPRQPPAP